MEINVVDTLDSGLVKVCWMLRRLNQPVIELPGMSNSVGRMVDAIIDLARRPQTVEVLRLYGHGHEGAINVTGGTTDVAADWAGIDLKNVNNLAAQLLRLRPYFTPNARVELQGCLVAKGRDGETLLQELARIFQARVQAKATKFILSTVQFSGPVVEADPRGGLRTVDGSEVSRVTNR